MDVHETMLRVAWESSIGTSRAAQRVFRAVVARHREPHRRYHGLRHVEWVVRHVGELAEHEPVVDRGSILAAAFFHDAVYQPTATATGPIDHEKVSNEQMSNEQASARLARAELTGLDDPEWPAARVERVASMILATATHLVPDHAATVDPATDHPATDHPATVDTAVLLDADLAVLGADPAAYQAYVNGVRAEYSHVDAAHWRVGRRSVLESFIARRALYATPTGREWWEARARANLAAELATLT